MPTDRYSLTDRYFLDVRRSALGRAWRPRLDAAGDARALALAQRHGYPDMLARVLAGRGVAQEDAELFLAPSLRDLMPEPYRLQDMEPAVERLARAVERGERVAIFGDYDVDGACSAALLALYLRHCGVAHAIHIPDRALEGYGPNIEAIRAMAGEGASLLVTVDCGTTSHEVFAQARALGLDIVVLDHHLAPETLPDAIVVNPNRQDDLSGQGALCAAGVAFLALVALNRRLRDAGHFAREDDAPDLLGMLDLVALATVADVAPLTGLNRAFVAKGLMVMRRRERIGLTALLDSARIAGPPQAWHLGFALGPRINAGGRIGDAALGARLLLEQDPAAARAIAAELDRLNGERRAIEQATVDAAQAEALAARLDADTSSVVVVSGDDWMPGIVGLVAARLKEKFNKPSFAFGINGKYAVGSGRSIGGVDLGAAVRAAVEAGVLAKGGGHRMAAGATIDRERLGEFRAFLEERLAGAVAAARADNALRIDAAVSGMALRPDLVGAIERAGPFGAGAPEPVFGLARHVIRGAQPVGASHLRLALATPEGGRLDAIAFRAQESPLGEAIRDLMGEPAHLAVALSLDRYGGAERVQTRVIDIAKID